MPETPLLSLPVLNSRFRDAAHFERRAGTAYSLLPLRFLELDRERFVLTNFCGEHIVLPKEVARSFLLHELPRGSEVYDELKSRHFLLDGDSTAALDLLAVKYRTRQAFLAQGIGLFLFVVSLRCEHSCPYCQVSRQSADRSAYDMTIEDADRALDLVFQSPSSAIKLEFQGGEPLLNFELVRHVVIEAKRRNETARRDLQFVIATNLALLSDEVLEFAREHDILFSTSLDGPEPLHRRNRPRPGGDSYQRTVKGIRRIRESLGPHRVAALMTTTEASLAQPREIVDEYVRQGFSAIFLRPLSPFGFAVKTGMAASYETDRWLEFYRTALDHILDLNRRGIPFCEEYSALILRKMLTPYATGYVDLQSPAGLGISTLVFNYNGEIYASDEARMLAETGDTTFRVGRLGTSTYDEVLFSRPIVETIAATMTEGMPMCSDCGLQPYCGSDPVYHHATQGDAVGFKPTSGFCRRNMGVIRHLIRLLEDDPAAAEILRGWV